MSGRVLEGFLARIVQGHTRMSLHRRKVGSVTRPICRWTDTSFSIAGTSRGRLPWMSPSHCPPRENVALPSTQICLASYGNSWAISRRNWLKKKTHYLGERQCFGSIFVVSDMAWNGTVFSEKAIFIFQNVRCIGELSYLAKTIKPHKRGNLISYS